MKPKKGKKTVFVAMSGGVDSSVAAALLKKQSYNVVGITMCFNIKNQSKKKPACCGADGIADAKRAADILNIPHYVLNFADNLDRYVIRDFTGEYLNGRTPNPCVKCNTHLKFDILLKKARALGADYLATGHYARLKYSKSRKKFEIKKGKDKYKEQSYFLYGIKKKALPYLLFPLGNLKKKKVREIAVKYNLLNAQKPASQDICFIPDSGYKKFIEEKIGKDSFVAGDIKDELGNAVGTHKGIANYTIGQGDKLGIALGRRVYVYRIDKKNNTIHVGGNDKLLSKSITVKGINPVSVDLPNKPFKAKVKIRYNHKAADAKIKSIGKTKALVEFKKPQRAATPGQSAVFYKDDVMLAGGIIEKALK